MWLSWDLTCLPEFGRWLAYSRWYYQRLGFGYRWKRILGLGSSNGFTLHSSVTIMGQKKSIADGIPFAPLLHRGGMEKYNSSGLRGNPLQLPWWNTLSGRIHDLGMRVWCVSSFIQHLLIIFTRLTRWFTDAMNFLSGWEISMNLVNTRRMLKQAKGVYPQAIPESIK